MSSEMEKPYFIHRDKSTPLPEGLVTSSEKRQTSRCLFTCRSRETNELLVLKGELWNEILPFCLPVGHYSDEKKKSFPSEEAKAAYLKKENWKVESIKPIKSEGRDHVKVRMVNEALLPLAPGTPNYLHLFVTADHKSVIAFYLPASIMLKTSPEYMTRLIQRLRHKNRSLRNPARQELLHLSFSVDQEVIRVLEGMTTGEILTALTAFSNHYDSGDEVAERVVSRLSKQALEGLQNNPVEVNVQFEKDGVLIPTQFNRWEWRYVRSNRFWWKPCDAQWEAQLGFADRENSMERMGELMDDIPWSAEVPTTSKAFCTAGLSIPAFPGISKREIWMVIEERLLRSGLTPKLDKDTTSSIQKTSWSDSELVELLKKGSNDTYSVRDKYEKEVVAAVQRHPERCTELLMQMETRSQIFILTHLHEAWNEEMLLSSRRFLHWFLSC